MSAQLFDFPQTRFAARTAAAPRGPEPADVRALRAGLAIPAAVGPHAVDTAAQVVRAFEALPLAEAAVFSVRTLTGGRRVGVSHSGWSGALTVVEARMVADSLIAQPFGPGAFTLANDLIAVAFAVEAETAALDRPARDGLMRRLSGPHVTGLGFLMGLTLLTLSAMALAAWPDFA